MEQLPSLFFSTKLAAFIKEANGVMYESMDYFLGVNCVR